MRSRSFRSFTSIMLICGGVSVLGIASARASVIGTVWENAGNPGNAADVAGNTTGPHADFTSSGIAYCSAPGLDALCSPTSNYTVSGFLNSPAFTGATAGFNPNQNFNNTFIQLTGSVSLNAGANSFNIAHDDGLTLTVTGIGLVVNAPGPTGPTVTPFTINAPSAGNYDFTLNYAECCGAPAILLWSFPSGTPVGSTVPEPSYFALIGVGLPAMVFFAQRRRSKVK